MDAKRKNRRRKILLVGGVLLAVVVFLHWPVGRVKIVVSPETTVIDGPLNADGTVNYVAALDRMFAEGVTPENNAAPNLLKAFGLSILRPDEIGDQILGRLGLTAEDVGEGKFIPWGDRTVQISHDTARTQPAFIRPDGSEVTLDEAYASDVRQMLRAGRVHPDLDAWLRENAEALQLIQETVAAKPRFYVPLVSPDKPPTVISIIRPAAFSLRCTADALAIRAGWRSRHGDRDGAWADVMTVHRLARLVSQAPTIIDQIVATQMEQTAADDGVMLATRGPMDSQEARRLLAALESLPPLRPVAEVVDRHERLSTLDWIMVMSRGRRPDDTDGHVEKAPNLDWNELLRHVNAWHDRMVVPFRTGRLEGRSQAAERFLAQCDALSHRLASRGFRAKAFLYGRGGWPFRRAFTRHMACAYIGPGILFPTLTRANDLRDQALMAGAVETAAVALAGFKADQGRWPASLDELAPAYLKRIPSDLFRQGPLVYRPDKAGYVLYSVGINQRDDGGVEDPPSDRDDIVARVGPALPAESAATTTASAAAGD